MFKLKGLDHIAISVSDLDRSIAWYRDTLGFENLHPGLWNGVPVFVGRDNAALALFPAKQKPSPPAPGKGEPRILHFAFRAARSDFIAAQSELRRRNISFEFEDHEISHSIYLQDPDGHTLEITTYEVA